MNLKEHRRKQLCPPQDGLRSGRDWNYTSAEYKRQAIAFQLTCSSLVVQRRGHKRHSLVTSALGASERLASNSGRFS
jgi:hypothetical protein